VDRAFVLRANLVPLRRPKLQEEHRSEKSHREQAHEHELQQIGADAGGTEWMQGRPLVGRHGNLVRTR
jgi:hypothetical protein